MPIADRHNEYAQEIAKKLKEKDIRVETDLRREKIGAKIRDAQVQKVPYMLILGDKEAKENMIAVRHRTKGDLGGKKLKDFLSGLRQEIDSRD